MTHTRTYTKKRIQKRRRQRAIPYIFGNDRLETLFWRLLDDRDPELRIYAYRFRDGQKFKPALAIIKPPFTRLIDWLRDKQGGGDFYIIIRRGKRMELSGVIGIVGPDEPIPEVLRAFFDDFAD